MSLSGAWRHLFRGSRQSSTSFESISLRQGKSRNKKHQKKAKLESLTHVRCLILHCWILTFCWIFLNHWFYLYWNSGEIDLSAVSGERVKEEDEKLLDKKIYFSCKWQQETKRNLYKWNTCVILKVYERNEYILLLNILVASSSNANGTAKRAESFFARFALTENLFLKISKKAL